MASAKSESWLSWFLRGSLILFFLVLVAKLFEVQIIKGSYYRTLSEENRIRHISIAAPRGKILARGGEELTGPGFAHITGYLAKVSADEIDKVDPNCPERGVRKSESIVGRTGLQEQYQCRLQGWDGEELIEVDTTGEKLRTLAIKDPSPGENLITTIDFNLQSEVVSQMAGKSGAVIVTDSKGEILAFYSSPSYDPQNLGPSLTNKELPLFNRVIGGTFHPGSVFKPLVALAALSEGAIDKNYQYTDQGKIDVNEFSYTNWYFTQYGGTEGTLGLTKALARSTDTFFYKIGEIVGPQNIAKWAKSFGLDSQTGIDIPGEVSGLIPTPEWKKEYKKENWFLGNTYHMAIGQGDVSTTPIEINTYIAAIASEGQYCNPHFLVEENSKCKKLAVERGNIDLVKEGMKSACLPGGTAFTFFDYQEKYNTDVACKTGTAEVGLDGEPHAWFTLFTPIDGNSTKPQVVATVLIERGGEGSKVAGPIARSIMDKWELIQNP